MIASPVKISVLMFLGEPLSISPSASHQVMRLCSSPVVLEKISSLRPALENSDHAVTAEVSAVIRMTHDCLSAYVSGSSRCPSLTADGAKDAALDRARLHDRARLLARSESSQCPGVTTSRGPWIHWRGAPARSALPPQSGGLRYGLLGLEMSSS